MVQREKPAITAYQLAAAVGRPPDSVTISGGMIENFREGWAINAMSFGKAHYYRRNRFDNAVALCGKWVEVRWVYGEGNFPRCKTCEKSLAS